MGFAPFSGMEICPEFVPVLGQNNHFQRLATTTYQQHLNYCNSMTYSVKSSGVRTCKKGVVSFPPSPLWVLAPNTPVSQDSAQTSTRSVLKLEFATNRVRVANPCCTAFCTAPAPDFAPVFPPPIELNKSGAG
jgi:hypothetical protein